MSFSMQFPRCDLTAAEKLPNVDFHCEHKLVAMDIENTKLHFKVYVYIYI